MMKSEEITQSQGVHGHIEKAKRKGEEIDFVEDHTIRTAWKEINHEGDIGKIHYGDYYKTLNREQQKVEDYAQLGIMEATPNFDGDYLQSYRKHLAKKYS